MMGYKGNPRAFGSSSLNSVGYASTYRLEEEKYNRMMLLIFPFFKKEKQEENKFLGRRYHVGREGREGRE